MEAMERAAKTANIGNLFADDPTFKVKARDSRGRFATAERAAYDRTRKENSFLKFQVEKYRRLAGANDVVEDAKANIIDDVLNQIRDIAPDIAIIEQ